MLRGLVQLGQQLGRARSHEAAAALVEKLQPQAAALQLDDLGWNREELSMACSAIQRYGDRPLVAARRLAPGQHNWRAFGHQQVFMDGDLDLGLFVLPAFHVLEFHDHPSMWVLSRVLAGKVRLTSCDRVPPEEETTASNASQEQSTSPPPPAFRIRDLQSTVLEPSSGVWVTSPTKANLHRVEALEDTAFFDLIAPPYVFPEPRPCTYYAVDEAKLIASPVRQHPDLKVLNFAPPPNA